ncbi:hypothetical protein [Arsenicibacter rosenii]|uniref:Uncharacterized protein n=1 Tax=Arsenicibacter rosenii TaxID=1750698 RepID=A0A1S2VGI6_9BACT|nr:hypothetical protein [Arsenicibacter rosenii]OIN57375.1 hypothetical protein BLX24_20600 [Arsenicibacter rosenii]
MVDDISVMLTCSLIHQPFGVRQRKRLNNFDLIHFQMAAIDQYKHRLIHTIECPADDDFVYGSPTRTIAIYELLEDIPSSEKDFDGKTGDILVGGGSGEAMALRISIPEVFVDGDERRQVFKPFWSSAFAYKVGVGFRKIGWKPGESDLEAWLVNYVVQEVLLKDNR